MKICEETCPEAQPENSSSGGRQSLSKGVEDGARVGLGLSISVLPFLPDPETQQGRCQAQAHPSPLTRPVSLWSWGPAQGHLPSVCPNAPWEPMPMPPLGLETGGGQGGVWVTAGIRALERAGA